MELLADVGTSLPAWVWRVAQGSLVSLDQTRPKRDGCQVSHVFHSCWAFPSAFAKIYPTSKGDKESTFLELLSYAPLVSEGVSRVRSIPRQVGADGCFVVGTCQLPLCSCY